MIVDGMSTPVAKSRRKIARVNNADQLAQRLRAACIAARVEPKPNALSRATKNRLSASLCCKYLLGQTKLENIPGVSIFELAKALNVSARWLLLGIGHPSYRMPSNDDENELVQLMRSLPEESRSILLKVARSLVAEQRSAPITARHFLPNNEAQ